MDATTVAVDLAKSVFQLAVADASWRVVVLSSIVVRSKLCTESICQRRH